MGNNCTNSIKKCVGSTQTGSSTNSSDKKRQVQVQKNPNRNHQIHENPIEKQKQQPKYQPQEANLEHIQSNQVIQPQKQYHSSYKPPPLNTYVMPQSTYFTPQELHACMAQKKAHNTHNTYNTYVVPQTETNNWNYNEPNSYQNGQGQGIRKSLEGCGDQLRQQLERRRRILNNS